MSKRVKRYDEWTQVLDIEDEFTIYIIGDEKRFSISIEMKGVKFGINGCRIVKGKNGKFISFPAWKDSEGKYHDYTFLSFQHKEDVDSIVEMF